MTLGPFLEVSEEYVPVTFLNCYCKKSSKAWIRIQQMTESGTDPVNMILNKGKKIVERSHTVASQQTFPKSQSITGSLIRINVTNIITVANIHLFYTNPD